MNNEEKKPREYDAVLGGNNPPPVDGVVLGGIAGIKSRLSSKDFEAKLAAVREALKYDNEGIELILNVLKNSSEQFQYAAAKVVKKQGSSKAKQALLDYNPYLFFTTLKDWQWQKAYPEVRIEKPHNTAYIVICKEVFKSGITKKTFRLDGLQELLKDKQISKIEALIFQIDCDGNQAFKVCTKAICDVKEQLPNLKALFIGDSEEHQFRKSKLDVFDIRPILETYPNLEMLQVRGRFSEDRLECADFRHENLKTLIIETADLSEYNFTQICNLDLPALEYLEIWLGRRICYHFDDNRHLDNMLANLLSGQSFPNLKYLALKSSEPTDIIAEKIIQSPLLDRLLILDLSMGCLTDEGRALLRNCPKIEKLHTLDISENYGSYYKYDGEKHLSRNEGSDRYCALYE